MPAAPGEAPGKCAPNPRGSSLLREPWRGSETTAEKAEKEDEVDRRDRTHAHGCLSRNHGVARDGGDLENVPSVQQSGTEKYHTALQ